MKINRGNTFYIQRMKWNFDSATEEETLVVYDNASRPVDIEMNYNAVYSECKGIEDIGKAKNIYTEDYADSSFLRAYIPKQIAREATDVTLTLYFFGEHRQANLARFIKDITGGDTDTLVKNYGTPYRYYDTIRMKGFDFIYMENTTVEEDVWKGNLPYIKVSFKLKNIYGEASTDRIIDISNYE